MFMLCFRRSQTSPFSKVVPGVMAGLTQADAYSTMRGLALGMKALGYPLKLHMPKPITDVSPSRSSVQLVWWRWGQRGREGEGA